MNAPRMAILFWMTSNVFSQDICDKFSVNHLKIIECNNRNRNDLKVITIEKDANVKSEYIDSFMNGLIPSLVETMFIPVTIRNFSLAYEEEIYDYSELFSRSGTMFNLREKQRNKTLIYDGQAFANHSYKNQAHTGVIVLVENIETLDDYLEGSVRPPFHSTQALYTIFVMVQEDNTESIVERVLEKLWRDYGILIALIAFVCQDDVGFCRFLEHELLSNLSFYLLLQVVTYMNHFTLKSHHSNISYPHAYGVVQKVLLRSNMSLICDRNMDNYPTQFYGFPLRVMMFEEDPMSIPWNRFPNAFRKSNSGQLSKFNPLTCGYNGLTVAGLVQILNFTADYKFINESSEKYSNKKNGIIVGSGQVAYSKYDLVGVLHFMIGKNGMDYDYLHHVLFDKYCIVAPKAKAVPLIHAAIRCFTFESWALIISIPWSLTVTLKLTNFLKPFRDNGLMNSRAIRILNTFYKILFAQAASILTNANNERWLLASCMCFSIVFTTIFQANLTSYVTTERRYKDINTLKELADSGLKIVTSSQYMINVVFGDVQNSSDPVIKVLRKNFQLGGDSLKKTINGRSCCIRQELDYEITNVSIIIFFF